METSISLCNNLKFAKNILTELKMNCEPFSNSYLNKTTQTETVFDLKSESYSEIFENNNVLKNNWNDAIVVIQFLKEKLKKFQRNTRINEVFLNCSSNLDKMLIELRVF